MRNICVRGVYDMIMNFEAAYLGFNMRTGKNGNFCIINFWSVRDLPDQAAKVAKKQN